MIIQFHISIFVLHFGRIASLIYFIGIACLRVYFISLSPAFFIAGSIIGKSYLLREITFYIVTMPPRLWVGGSQSMRVFGSGQIRSYLVFIFDLNLLVLRSIFLRFTLAQSILITKLFFIVYLINQVLVFILARSFVRDVD